MKFRSIQITAPATTPVSVAEVKNYLRVDDAADDTLIGILIGAAVKLLEDDLSMKFINQQWDFWADTFGERKSEWWDGTREMARSALQYSGELCLPVGRIVSVDKFSTYDNSDNEIAENVSNYVVDKVSKQGRLGLKMGGLWPTTVLRPINGIQIRATLGFGATAADVPQDIKQAIMEVVGHSYENRGDQDKMTIPDHVHQLIRSWKVVRIG